MIKKIISFIIMVLLVSTYNTTIINSFEINSEEGFFNDSDCGCNPNISLYNDIDEPEKIILKIDETIKLSESGLVDISLMILPDSTLCKKLYSESLGLNDKNNSNVLLPDDKIIVTSGIDGFSESMKNDHLMMLGISIFDYHIKEKNLDVNDFKIDYESKGLIRTSQDTKGYKEVDFGPFSIVDSKLFYQYISLKIGFQKLLMNTIEDEQIFESEWTSKIIIPENSILLNKDELINKNWCLDFGGGTILKSTIEYIDGTTILLKEYLIVTENETFNPAVLNHYKTFNIKYTSQSDDKIQSLDENDFFSKSDFGLILFQWEKNIDCNKNDVIHPPLLPLEIEYTVQCLASFKVFITTEQANVTASLYLSTNLTVTFTDDCNFSTGWKNITKAFEWRVIGYYGCIIIWVDIEVLPEYQIQIEIDEGTSITFGAWIHGDLNMGAKYSLSKGFDIIWEKDFDYGFYEPEVTIENLKITPMISVLIKAKLYDVIGPCVRPIVYVQCIINYIDSELYWRIKIGFNLTVGLCVGIPYFNDVCWEWDIYGFVIKEWDNIDPSVNIDSVAPKTDIYFYPTYNGYTGKNLFLWFNTTDLSMNDEIPVGIKKTEYNIDNSGWEEYNYSNFSIMEIFNSNQIYDIKYKSTDRLYNEEPTRIKEFRLDSLPPISSCSIGNPKNIDDVYDKKMIFSYHTPLSLSATDGATSWEIWYRIQDPDGNWTEWKKGEYEEEITYYFTTIVSGEYTLEYFSMDRVWNAETVKSIYFYVNANIDTIKVTNIFLHKIAQIDDFDPYWIGWTDQCDWYYYIGYSEDDVNYYWRSSAFPIIENVDELIINDYHQFYTGKDEITINIMVCEKDDWWVDNDYKDDIADICSHQSDGMQVTYNERIYPPENEFELGSANFIYNLSTNAISGIITTIFDGFIKTSGEYDYINHNWDAYVLFNIFDYNYNHKPIANFTFSPNHISKYEIVNFTDLSTDDYGYIVNWS